MSSDARSIVVEGLGKRYVLGATTGARSSYRSLGEDLVGAFRRDRRPTEPRHLWALRNVSFDVSPGERVGVIGRNGAGKSTLLKLLSRITAPSEGRAEIRGRVGSLLEVGTGFHPELTGRDNISLAGAILGMQRREIAAKLDQIVEFAGVERFLDTPVKRYSSGMYLRLAFAVAAHLEPEILLVDEVLAVGDADFQKKCLGRMEEIGQSGRTVLFVSHSMPSVLRLCDRVVLFDQGGVLADGAPKEVIRTYLESGLGSSATREWETPEQAPGDTVCRLKAVRALQDGEPREEIDIARPLDIEAEYWLLQDADHPPFVNLHITNEDGVLLFITADYTNLAWRVEPRRQGTIRARCRIPANYLAEGRHFVLAAISSLNPTVIHANEADVVSFQVVDRTTGQGARGEWSGDLPGVVRPLLPWTISDDRGCRWPPEAEPRLMETE
jgi:lipopolysaccharide transport system ATP-binding protein